MRPMIPFEEIDAALKALGKDRVWLSLESGRKPDSIRVALAPGAPSAKRSELLQKALSDAIEREEERQKAEESAQEKVPVGYSQIFLSDEELDRADRAARIIDSPSLAVFCHDIIQAEARRIIAGAALAAQLHSLPAADIDEAN